MTPVGVFFICPNEDKCYFVNSAKVSQTDSHTYEKADGFFSQN